MGTGKNITLQPSSFVSPTAFTMLGGTDSQTGSITTIIQGTSNGGAQPTTTLFKQITVAGVYLFTVMTQTTWATSLPVYYYTNIMETLTLPVYNTTVIGGTSINGTSNWGMQTLGAVLGGNYIDTNGSMVYTVTTSKINYYYVLGVYIYSAGSLGPHTFRMDITRLA